MSQTGLSLVFLRDLVESVERQHPAALTRVALRLPERLVRHLAHRELDAAKPGDVLAIETGEQLVLGLDAVLGGGSGEPLADIARDLATRYIAEHKDVILAGSFHGSMLLQRAELQRPFVGLNVRVSVERTLFGATLNLGVAGRPEATWILSQLARGRARATHRLVRDTTGESLETYSDVHGDQATLVFRICRTSRRPDPHPQSRAAGNSVSESGAKSRTEPGTRIEPRGAA